MTIANYAENKLLDAIFNNASYVEADRFLQLHTADPGETGANNVATETTRKSITGAAAVAGTFTSVNDLTWTNVAGTETYSHVSIWDAVAAGNCLWVGALTVAKAVTAGDTFSIATGSLTVSLD